MHERGYPYWEHAGHGHPFLWFLTALLFALLVAAVVVLVVRWLAERRAPAAPLGPTAGSAADALAVVRMRYARGEIDREQFLQASADLGGGYPVPPPDAPTAA